MPTPDESPEVRAVERWFVRRGVPHFIVGYSAGEDIWTRSLPVLGAAYVLGGLNALDLGRFSLARNLGALAASLGILLAGYILANLLRGRRPFAIPRRVGWPELVLVVVGPAVPALVFGQPRDALESMLIGIVVIALIYLVTSYALVAIVRWGIGQLGGQLADVGRLVAKALPLLLLIVTALFLTAEVWQSAGTRRGAVYCALLGLLFVVGTGFVVARIPADVALIARFSSWEEVDGCAVRTPAAALPAPPPGTALEDTLSRREWINIALVLLITQGVQIILVALAVGLFFVVFGVLAIDEADVATWTGDAAHVLATLDLNGQQLVLTEEHLAVAGFLAAFTGLVFTVYLVTDAVYREQFGDQVVADVRTALAARVRYRCVVAGA